MVCENAIDKEVVINFRETRLICDKVPASYFEVPEKPQPDQILQDNNEPLDNSGIDVDR